MNPPKTLTRTLTLDVRAADDDGIPAVLSTDIAVERDGYREVLDHSPGAIDLSRAPLPLIESHNGQAVNIGIVDGLKPVGGKLRGLVKFGKSARARELVEDVQAGIVRSLSIAYQIIKHRIDGDTLTATRWLPYEASLVAIPADINAGFYRNGNMENINVESRESGEAGRVRAISAAAHQFKQHDLGQRAISEGWSAERFNQAIIDSYSARPVQTQSDLGLTDTEKREFSFVALARHLSNPTDRKLRDAAGFELDVCRASDHGEGVRIPHDVLAYRDLSKAGTTTGAAIVGETLLESSFIDMLRNALVVRQAGATFIDGLQGDAQIPRQTGGSTFYYVAEGSPVSESNPTFDQVPLTPHTVGTFVDVTRRLLIQSTPSVEGLVRRDFAEGIARAIDSTALFGNPDITAQANRPRGVAYTTGIGSRAGGTNGAAPNRSDLVALKREVSIDNANGARMAFITNSKVLAKLEDTLLDTGSGRFVYEGDGILTGKPVWETNTVPSNLTKGSADGVCSAILYGDWSQLIVGAWSGIDLISDVYTQGLSGGLRLICLHDFDVAVRKPQAFSAMLDVLT